MGSPISHVSKSFIPAIFATGLQDSFIKPHHAEDLQKAYVGESQFVGFEGDHNSPRPDSFHRMAQDFLRTCLHRQVCIDPRHAKMQADLENEAVARELWEKELRGAGSPRQPPSAPPSYYPEHHVPRLTSPQWTAPSDGTGTTDPADNL